MSTATQQERFLNAHKASRQLQTDSRMLDRYVKRGLIRRYVDGLGRHRYSASEIEAVAAVRPASAGQPERNPQHRPMG